MPPDVDTPADLDLNGVIERVLAVNPFLDNRVNGPTTDGADVAGIHQAAFERLTSLAAAALAAKRGIGAMLWGEAGIGKSHLLSRLARWSADHATFVYLHNLQAAPEQLPRSLLRAVVSALTRGRVSAFYHTPLAVLVQAGLLEALGHKDGVYPWTHLYRAWNAFVDHLVAGEHPGLAGAERTIYQTLFLFFYSAHRARHPHPDGSRREDGNVARLAVRWLSGLALEPDEARTLVLPPAVPRDEPVALADVQQIKQVLVALARLAAARRQPFVLAFDQVDNLDTDQASALARFLEALIDAAPNLLVVTAGVRATLFRWRQERLIQDSSWDRLAQFEVELQRVNGTEAGELIRARLDDFWRPYENLSDLQQRRQQDEYFPLGRAWYERQFHDKTDLRPRDVINLAREAWPARASKKTTVQAVDTLLDQMLDEKIAQLCPPQAQPPERDTGDLAELLRTVLIQCRDAAPAYGLLEVKRVPPVRKHQKPLYDLSILVRGGPDAPAVRVGLLALNTPRAAEVTVRLRRLTKQLPVVDRFVLLTTEHRSLPLGSRGTRYLTALQHHFGERFGQLEVTPTEHLYLDALRTTAQLARAGDLEVETADGPRPVTEEQVIASHHRKDRYRSSRVLRKLLGTPAAETLPDTAAALQS
jgi:hypothetical protein